MDINHILFVSEMNPQIKDILNSYHLTQSYRFVTEAELSETDLDWADAFVSFQLSEDYDFSKVKWVHSLGAGVDHFLYKKSWDEQVLLTRMTGPFGQRITEYCLSYILADLQCHTPFSELQAQTTWQPKAPRLLSEAKVLIYGTGKIGQHIAKVLSSLGMKVYGVSLSGNSKPNFETVTSFSDHFSKITEMDYLINTLPLTEKTDQIFNRTLFQYTSQLLFINVGRGESVCEKDLLEALTSEHVRGAILDVFAHEPLGADHPFWRHPKIRMTPHIAAITTPEEAVACFVETLQHIENKHPLPNKVDMVKGY
ncbi:D-2-hydroxyacid dehydrogenase [Gracilibacillus timonensis]|uniref:D-2-hydroxyacid dehydrogenase n=1 Tax=Gracilibacillus timonensis TaxID=1816696 RepID=UPI000825912D|nr:D-2-hydroxyacid dehydrogenase [Gracilibacillus timonensis]